MRIYNVTRINDATWNGSKVPNDTNQYAISHSALVSEGTWYGLRTQALALTFNIWKANGVIFRRIEIHKTQFKFHSNTMCHRIKFVHRIEILHGWKIMLIHNGFQIVIAILYYIIQRTKSIYRNQMRSDFGCILRKYFNGEQWTHVLTADIPDFWLFGLSMLM